MTIVLSALLEDEIASTFDLFEQYMKPIIDNAFGWDEEFQRKRFESNFQPEWFSWAMLQGENVGLVCSHLKSTSIHVHLLIVFTEFQRRGFASLITRKLHAEAIGQELDLTLSCFKNNIPALKLYEQLGFMVVSEDEHFYDFISREELT